MGERTDDLCKRQSRIHLHDLNVLYLCVHVHSFKDRCVSLLCVKINLLSLIILFVVFYIKESKGLITSSVSVDACNGPPLIYTCTTHTKRQLHTHSQAQT